MLLVLIYLHFNRKERKLEDFGLHLMKRWSDASHNLPGIYDRVMDWFRSEDALLASDEKFDTDLEEIRIKEQFGPFVTKRNMNHSDKKLCALRSLHIHFDMQQPTPTNDQSETSASQDNSHPTVHTTSIESTPKGTISIETDNAKWILLCVTLLTAMSVMPYKIWAEKPKLYPFINHWSSFLLTKLTYGLMIDGGNLCSFKLSP